jgi:hypothetical protein
VAQEKVLSQVEAEKAATPPKPSKSEEPKKAAATADAEAEVEEEEKEEDEEEEDPVEKALSKYGIITENPWEPGVKCAVTPAQLPSYVCAILACACALHMPTLDQMRPVCWACCCLQQ